ncbi:hypothetical protein Q2490_15125 [Myroides odoratimimus]|uniref:hypothetical protein n=1 Tax=Myroides odoratimimus TaxID=76832 RepID=UPI0026DEA720|nr:hypothetical protein [Myroides odoratimimus]MDO5858616.1 hypothetical protein [Myroides odoratimimus]
MTKIKYNFTKSLPGCDAKVTEILKKYEINPEKLDITMLIAIVEIEPELGEELKPYLLFPL